MLARQGWQRHGVAQQVLREVPGAALQEALQRRMAKARRFMHSCFAVNPPEKKVPIFDDQKGIMNISLKEHNGEALVVSQFTLHALTKKGNRPSYIKAASPEIALPIYNQFVEQMQSHLESPVKTGVFGANMKVKLSNDGPATFIIDTKNRE